MGVDAGIPAPLYSPPSTYTSPTTDEDPQMNRFTRFAAFAVAAAGLAACSSPMEPTVKCDAKAPECTNVNFVNPNVNFVNPNVNFVNPNV